MKYLNSLKDLRLYRMQGYRITGMDKEVEDTKRNHLVLHVGYSPNSFQDLLNANFLRRQNFKHIWTPRVYRTLNRRKRVVINKRNYYSSIRSKVEYPLRIMRTDPNKTSSNYNLMVDLGKFLEYENDSLTIRNRISIRNNLQDTMNRFLYDSYDNAIILFNLDGINTSSNELLRPSNHNNISMITNMIRREEDLFPDKKDKNITMIFCSVKKGLFMKVNVSDEETMKKNKALFRTRLRALLSIVNTISDDDVNSPIIDKSDSGENIPKVYEVEDTDEDQEDIDNHEKKFKDNKLNKNASRSLTNSQIGAVSTSKSNNNNVESKKDRKKKEDLEDSVEDIMNLITSDLEEFSPDQEDMEYLRDVVEKEIKKDKSLSTSDNAVDIIKAKPEYKRKLNSIARKDLVGSSTVKDSKKILTLAKDEEEALSRFEVDIDIEDKKIERQHNEISDILNEEISKNISINDFDRSYMDKQFTKDFVNTLRSFNDDEDLPVFIRDIKQEDTSDSQTYKTTISVKFRDNKNQNHSMTFDIPKIVNGKYMKVNGSKKIIKKQLIMKPIVKYKPDEVWITTNYAKYIIEKFGTKNSDKESWLNDVFNKVNINDFILPESNLEYRKGNASLINYEYTTSVEYSNISNFLLEINDGKYNIVFNQKKLLSDIEKYERLSNIKYDADLYFPVGYNSSKLLLINFDDLTMYEYNGTKMASLDTTLTDYLINIITLNTDIDELLRKVSPNVKSNSRLSYSRVKITNKVIPMIVVLAFNKGLSNILDRYDVDYYFTDKNERINMNENKSKIKFKDGYLIYKTNKLRYSLLLSGLNVIPTNEYTFEEMDTIDPYTNYFQDKHHSSNVGKGINNSLKLMIDPITKEVLQDMSLPENIIDLLLLANTMLEDVSSSNHNNMDIYRIRGAEQINALVYQMMANAYREYSDSSMNLNPKKMSVRKDQLIKTLMEQTTIDEVSDLNPSLEIDTATSVTYKGVGGRNNDQSFTPEIRSYDKSMQGVLGISSPDSSTVGVVRQISADSRIRSTRGYLDGGKDNLSGTELFTPLELLNPYTSLHADAPRIGMAGNQSKHVSQVKHSDPPLVGTGMDKNIAYQISDTFAFKAKDDGKVVSVDNRLGMMIVEYKNGDKDVIDISEKLAKNSNGGFYQMNQLTPMFNEGQSFVKGMILAKNEEFFKGNGKDDDIQFISGTLSKVAIASSYGT